ncbi:BglG family transcription antiterminator [Isobaculum melis]|uniref:Transcriptional antiterminator n=1 Tax=Isobaculum melis TaxID=142588 RepID=A0A1H9QVC9_9LACT|nr:HTH domain-containing protein [Isobaculum melis]SER64406.1 Transcriptional antiterminator [Isobaculum melis]
MFTHRQLLIISFLLTEGIPLSSSFLSAVLGVSERTIQSEIKEMNQYLPVDETFSISSKKKMNHQELSPATISWLKQLIHENKEINSHNLERKNLILMILFFEKNYLSMEELSKRLFVSKTMIHKEFEHSWKLREFIEVSSKKGLKMKKSESFQRNISAKIFSYSESLVNLLGLPADTQNKFEQVKKITNSLFLAHQYFISGKSLALFQNYLLMTIIRNKMGFHLVEGVDCLPEKPPMSALLNEIILALNEDFSALDIDCIQSKLNELNVTTYVGEIEEIGYYTLIKEKLTIFFSLLDAELGIKIKPSRTWEERFFMHMQKLLIRLDNGSDNDNYLKRKMNQTYPLTFQVLRDYFLPTFEREIPESELSYLVLYFAEFIEADERALDILFITDSLPSVIYHTSELIKKYSGFKVNHIKTVTVYEYLQKPADFEKNYEVMLTTSERVILESNRAFLIKELFNKEDLSLLSEYMSMMIAYRDRRRRQWFHDKFLKNIEIQNISSGNLKMQGITFIGKTITHEITLEEPLIFISSFNKQQASSIEIFQFQKKYRHRSKEIEYIVVSSYNPNEGNIQSFYHELHHLLKINALKKLTK